MKRFILGFKRGISAILQKIFFNRESVVKPETNKELAVYVDTTNNNALTGLNSDNEEIVLAKGVERPF
jgi:hypothetical protein